MSTKQYIPIFVGSTYEDLIDYRKAVKESLVRLETVVHGMEYFGSKPGTPKEECLKAVRNSKIYIGIFSMRYGSIDDETKLSMTHLEYLEAQRIGLPSLIYILDDNIQPILAKHIDQGEKMEKLNSLKEELKRKFLVSFFTTPDDLAIKVSQDLPEQLKNIGISVPVEKVDSADIDSLIKRFKNRPKKYAGTEIVVEVVIDGNWGKPFDDRVTALQLDLGDVICAGVKNGYDVYGYQPFFAEGRNADLLESMPKDSKVRLKLKLIYGVQKTLQWGDDSQFVKEELEIGFKVVDVLT